MDKTRLAEVKNTFGEKFIHSDIKWLIEQAEKAERYEKALKRIANENVFGVTTQSRIANESLEE